MQVEVVRRGGFAGIREVLVSFDSDTLTAAQAAHLQQLVNAVLALEVPPAVGADGFEWVTTVRDETGERTVVVGGETEPAAEPVRRLLAGP